MIDTLCDDVLIPPKYSDAGKGGRWGGAAAPLALFQGDRGEPEEEPYSIL